MRQSLYQRIGFSSVSDSVGFQTCNGVGLASLYAPPVPKPAAQVIEMRHTANFHPEWGYLAPAPSFIRTARVVLVATAVGAIVGAGAGFSRVSHQPTEPSVAARTLVRPIEAISARAKTPTQATQADAPSSTEKRSLTVNSRSADGAANEPSASSATRLPGSVAAVAEVPEGTDGPATAAIVARPKATNLTESEKGEEYRSASI